MAIHVPNILWSFLDKNVENFGVWASSPLEYYLHLVEFLRGHGGKYTIQWLAWVTAFSFQRILLTEFWGVGLVADFDILANTETGNR